MSWILNIETATKSCSVALAHNGKLVDAIEETSDQFVHSEKLTVFIEQLLKRNEIAPSQLAAVCVGKGPGSFTGLRIGVATAKGLCYALNIPLIAIDSLSVLANSFLQSHRVNASEKLQPMIDARRMEVYTSTFKSNLEMESNISAMIIDENSFSDKTEKLHLFGDGAPKLKETLHRDNIIIYDDIHPSAKAMVEMSYVLFQQEKFEDVAYFEPFYLKDFIVGVKK